MRSLTLVLISLITCGLHAQPRHAGVFAYEGGEGEHDCGLVTYRTRTTVEAYAQPDPASPVVRTVQPDRLIEGNDRSLDLTLVMQPGRAVVRRAATASCFKYGDVQYLAGERRPLDDRDVELRQGDVLEILKVSDYDPLYRSAAGVFGDCSPYTADGAELQIDLQREPAKEVWVRLVPREDRPAGWVNVTQDAVEAVGCEGLEEETFED
jgi:hypothetical protein